MTRSSPQVIVFATCAIVLLPDFPWGGGSSLSVYARPSKRERSSQCQQYNVPGRYMDSSLRTSSKCDRLETSCYQPNKASIVDFLHGCASQGIFLSPHRSPASLAFSAASMRPELVARKTFLVARSHKYPKKPPLCIPNNC